MEVVAVIGRWLSRGPCRSSGGDVEPCAATLAPAVPVTADMRALTQPSLRVDAQRGGGGGGARDGLDGRSAAVLGPVGAVGGQDLASGVTLSSAVVETAAGRKPRAIIQTASTISCTAKGMTNKFSSVELAPMTAYIASR